MKKYNFFLESKSFENELRKRIKPYLIEGKYLYHFTQTDNLESILDEGLIPRKYPNSYYVNVANGVFLTSSYSTYKANLPTDLIELLDDYYDNESDYTEKPIVKLLIDVTELDYNKFTWDDDYILNKYNYNKAITKIDKIVESLDIWYAIVYLDIIDKRFIKSHNFDY